jgi:peptide deformylase
MSILKVARMGHPVLREKARTLDRSEIGSPAIQRLVDDMIETMREYHGAGLAAPQVHEGLRIFVAALSDGRDEPEDETRTEPVVLINPEIVTRSGETEEDWEGCLSIPDLRGRVPRARDVMVKALDRHGTRIEVEASGFSARVIQHEYDHLDGVLFVDRMRSFETLSFLDEFSRYWSKSDD